MPDVLNKDIVLKDLDGTQLWPLAHRDSGGYVIEETYLKNYIMKDGVRYNIDPSSLMYLASDGSGGNIIKTITGDDVNIVDSVEYGLSNSPNVEPISWSAEIPVIIPEGSYLWTKTVYSNGATSYSISYQGKDGVPGQSTYIRYIEATIDNIIKDRSTNRFTPPNVSFSFKIVAGDSDPAPYTGYYEIKSSQDGTTYIGNVSGTGTSTSAYTPDSADRFIRCYLYNNSTDLALLDVKTVAILSDGLNGAAGITIDHIEEYYVLTQDTTPVPVPESSEWDWVVGGGSQGLPAMTQTDKYLWNYEKIYYSNNTTYISDPVIIGAYGDNGRGITSITEYYQVTNSTQAPETGTQDWDTTPQRVSENNKYLWNYEYILYTDGTYFESEPAIIGMFSKDGINGTDAYNAILSNENHTFPADETGYAINGSNTTGNILGFEGTSQIATYVDIEHITGTPTGLSFQVSDNGTDHTTYTVTASNTLNSANGTLSIPVILNRNSENEVTFYLSFSYSLAKAGTNGDDAIIYYIQSSASTINRNQDNALSPNTITFSAFKQIGNNNPAPYQGKFYVESTTDFSSWSAFYRTTSSINEDQATISLTGLTNTVMAIRCRFYSAGTTIIPEPSLSEVPLDSQTILFVKDGADAYNIKFRDENISFAGDDTKALSGQSVTTKLDAFRGVNRVQATINPTNANITVPTGMIITWNNTLPQADPAPSVTLTISGEMTTQTGTINIPVRVNNRDFTIPLYFNLILKGKDGLDVTSYEVVPSYNYILINTGNTILPSDTVTFAAYKLIGSNRVAYSCNFRIYTMGSSSTWTQVYPAQGQSPATESFHQYQISSIDITGIKAEIYSGNSKLDEESIPVITQPKDGNDGIGINSVSIMYAIVDNLTDIESSQTEWSATMPSSVGEGKYLITRTITDYTDSSIPDTIEYSYSYESIDGVNGIDGISVTIGTIEYRVNDSSTQHPLSGWSTTIPSTLPGDYLWTRTQLIEDSGSAQNSRYIYSVAYQGTNGTNGQNGQSVFIRYSNNSSGNPMLPVGQVGKYIGIHIGDSAPADYTGYAPWVQLEGTDGATPTNTSTQFAQTQTKVNPDSITTWDDTMPEPVPNYYMWTKITITYSDSTSSVIYNMAKNGRNGNNGRGVSAVTEYYKATSYISTPDDTGWSENSIPSNFNETNKYLWNYEVISWTDGSTPTSTPKAIIGVYGKDGKGITSITDWYLATNESNVNNLPTRGQSPWTTTVQTADSTHKYLWNYEVIDWTEGPDTETTPVIIGNWSKDGAAGRSVLDITEYYAVSDSSTTVPTSGWGTVIANLNPTFSEEYPYLWNYEYIDFSDGTDSTTSPQVISVYGQTGPRGADGNDGVGISDITEYYAKSSTATPSSELSWSTNIPEIDKDYPYLWNYEEITFTDESTWTSQPAIISRYSTSGSQIWTSEVAPSGLNNTFTISNLRGDSSASVKVGDIIFYGTNRYTITTVGSTTVDCTIVESLKGDTGAAGYNNATVYIYKRSPVDTIPTVPSRTLTYTFSTKTLSPSNYLDGWSQTIPASGTDPVWLTIATASATTTSDTIISSEWQTPIRLDGIDGINGQPGTDGTSPCTVILDNDSYIFPATDTHAEASSTTVNVIVYEGTTKLNYTNASSQGNGTYKIGTITGAPTGLTPTINTTNGVITITASTNLTTKSGVLTIPITIKTNTGTTLSTINKQFAWSLGLEGSDGTPATIYYLVLSDTVIKKTYSGSSTPSVNPSTITAYSYKRVGNGAQENYQGTIEFVYTGGSSTSSSTSSKQATVLPGWTSFTANLYTDSTKSVKLDTQSVAIIDGTISVSGVTEYYYAHTTDTTTGLPAKGNSAWKTSISRLTAPFNETNKYLWNYEQTNYTDGNNTSTDRAVIAVWSKDGARGTGISAIKEFYQLTGANSDGSPITPTSSGWVEVPGTGAIANTVPTTSESEPFLWNKEIIYWTDGSNTPTEPAIIGTHGRKGEKGEQGPKGDKGLDGYNQATIYLYKRAASTPTAPTDGALTYYFASNELKNGNTIITQDTDYNGWYRKIPEGSNPCYVTSVSLVATANTTSQPVSGWSGVSKLVQDGTNGNAGNTVAIVNVYQRAENAPTTPPDDAVYTFNSNSLVRKNSGGSLNGWSTIMPADDSNHYPVWVISATASSSNNTDDISSTEWQPKNNNNLSPIKFVQSGTDGAPATSYSLQVTPSAVIRDTNNSNTLSPSSISINAYSQKGSGARSEYTGRIKLEYTKDNSTWTSIINSDRSSYSYTIPSSGTDAFQAKFFRVSLYIAGGTTTLLDQQTIPVIDSGTDGQSPTPVYNAFLGNENQTFNADSAGNISPAITTTSKIYIYKGSSLLTPETPKTKVSNTYYTISTNSGNPSTGNGIPNGMSVWYNSSTQELNIIARESNSLPLSGSVKFYVTADSQTFELTFSYSKACNGTPAYNQALVTLYRKSSTPLSNTNLPGEIINYTFSTGALLGQSSSNTGEQNSPLGSSSGRSNWYKDIPAGDNVCYITTASAISTGSSVNLSAATSNDNGAWSTPRVYIKDGTDAVSAGINNNSTTLLVNQNGVLSNDVSVVINCWGLLGSSTSNPTLISVKYNGTTLNSSSTPISASVSGTNITLTFKAGFPGSELSSSTEYFSGHVDIIFTVNSKQFTFPHNFVTLYEGDAVISRTTLHYLGTINQEWPAPPSTPNDISTDDRAGVWNKAYPTYINPTITYTQDNPETSDIDESGIIINGWYQYWLCEETVYKNGSIEYTTPILDSRVNSLYQKAVINESNLIKTDESISLVSEKTTIVLDELNGKDGIQSRLTRVITDVGEIKTEAGKISNIITKEVKDSTGETITSIEGAVTISMTPTSSEYDSEHPENYTGTYDTVVTVGNSTSDVRGEFSNTGLNFKTKNNTEDPSDDPTIAWLTTNDGLGANELSIGSYMVPSNRWRIFTRPEGNDDSRHLTFTRHG